MKLQGKLHSVYKSFPAGFEFEIDGPIAVLSGANGSGKSQFLDIMRRLEQPAGKPKILLDLILDGTNVDANQIAFRSFREGIQGFKNADPELVRSSRNNIKSHYKKHRLDRNHKDIRNHQRSTVRAKEILVEVFGADKFQSGAITDDEIDSCDSLGDFIWKADDIFENVVSEVFYNFSVKKLQRERTAAKSKIKLSYRGLGEAPWKKFNKLFKQFNFGYRFRNDYEIAEKSFSLSEKPTLYPMKPNGSLILNHQRDLSELSDGERAIMSLVISSLTGEFADNAKLILLDEFDATLNPSLINILFGVLEEYFVQKSIMVILVTHSSATISMAPDNTTFYEVFNPIVSSERILRVNRDEYSELRLAHEKLFGSIYNQNERIQNLKAENDKLRKILEGTGMPTVLVEGPTDICFIKKAAEFHNKLPVLDKLVLQIVGEEGGKGTKRSNNRAMKEAGNFLRSNINILARKTLILNDPEVDVETEDVGEILFIRRMLPHSESSLSGGIEKLFPMTVIDRAKTHKPEWFKVETEGDKITNMWIIGKKAEVCKWICENSSADDFKQFAHIFEFIEEAIQ
ncbi:AAA family ATPase [Nitratireductor sp. XY-223]|uniref:AAA family ATPase n=1 Tax=Nitratireductor sp. XY-223 TaxID=2561926 RepID=UPI0010AB4DC0|nr:AAA family ATPase [Nitratireductor sp. XY-223]